MRGFFGWLARVSLRGTLAGSGKTGFGAFRVGTQRAREVRLLLKVPSCSRWREWKEQRFPSAEER